MQQLSVFIFSVYAFGETYIFLFVARAVQGVGSACIAIAGELLLISVDTC